MSGSYHRQRIEQSMVLQRSCTVLTCILEARQSDTLLVVIAFLRCLILMLFVVAGSTFESHCSPSMLDFDAICGVPEHLAILLFAFDA